MEIVRTVSLGALQTRSMSVVAKFAVMAFPLVNLFIVPHDVLLPKDVLEKDPWDEVHTHNMAPLEWLI